MAATITYAWQCPQCSQTNEDGAVACSCGAPRIARGARAGPSAPVPRPNQYAHVPQHPGYPSAYGYQSAYGRSGYGYGQASGYGHTSGYGQPIGYGQSFGYQPSRQRAGTSKSFYSPEGSATVFNPNNSQYGTVNDDGEILIDKDAARHVFAVPEALKSLRLQYAGNGQVTIYNKYKVLQWLHEVGGGEYAAGFAQHDVTGITMSSLKDSHLKKMGVKKTGIALTLAAALAFENAQMAASREYRQKVKGVLRDKERLMRTYGLVRQMELARTQMENFQQGRGHVPHLTPVPMFNLGQVERWLHQIGMGHYAAKFRHHHIDGMTLMDLGQKDYSTIGVDIVGDEKRLSAMASVEKQLMDLQMAWAEKLQELQRDWANLQRAMQDTGSDEAKEAYAQLAQEGASFRAIESSSDKREVSEHAVYLYNSLPNYLGGGFLEKLNKYEVIAWVVAAGLGQYAPLFAAQEINGVALAQLPKAKEAIGIKLIGHDEKFKHLVGVEGKVKKYKWEHEKTIRTIYRKKAQFLANIGHHKMAQNASSMAQFTMQSRDPSVRGPAVKLLKMTPGEVGRWLIGIGLPQFVPTFAAHRIDGIAIANLATSDFKDMKDAPLKRVGSYRRIMLLAKFEVGIRKSLHKIADEEYAAREELQRHTLTATPLSDVEEEAFEALAHKEKKTSSDDAPSTRVHVSAPSPSPAPEARGESGPVDRDAAEDGDVPVTNY